MSPIFNSRDVSMNSEEAEMNFKREQLLDLIVAANPCIFCMVIGRKHYLNIKACIIH
jgi:hypothetical protein